MENYEKEQVKAIQDWTVEEPGVVTQMLVPATVPFSWLLQKMIPKSIMKGLIEGFNDAASFLTDKDDILKKAGVTEIHELRTKDLAVSDKLAKEVCNWATGVGVVEGAATGVGGVLTLALDVPAVITLALRTIHKVGLCYGFDTTTAAEKNFVLGILSASGANSVTEKVTALTTLKGIEAAIAAQAAETVAEKIATDQLSKETGKLTIKKLASQLGVNITRRKALQLIPVIGAVVGGSVNGWFIKDVGLTATRTFQKRWLKGKYKDYDPLLPVEE